MLGSPGARRAYWAIASQGLDSASNFLLSVWVARSVAPREFGAFGLIYVAITMGAMLSRSAANMPMMISFATSAERFTASLAADVMGTALAVALGLSTLFLIFGLIISGPLHAIALIAAAVTPAVLLQDCVCYLFFARQQAQLAVVNNVVWLGVQGVAFWLATNAGHWHGAWIYLGLWGAAALTYRG